MDEHDAAVVDAILEDIRKLREEEDPDVWIAMAKPLINLFDSMLQTCQMWQVLGDPKQTLNLSGGSC